MSFMKTLQTAIETLKAANQSLQEASYASLYFAIAKQDPSQLECALNTFARCDRELSNRLVNWSLIFVDSFNLQKPLNIDYRNGMYRVSVNASALPPIGSTELIEILNKMKIYAQSVAVYLTEPTLPRSENRTRTQLDGKIKVVVNKVPAKQEKKKALPQRRTLSGVLISEFDINFESK